MKFAPLSATSVTRLPGPIDQIAELGAGLSPERLFAAQASGRAEQTGAFWQHVQASFPDLPIGDPGERATGEEAVLSRQVAGPSSDKTESVPDATETGSMSSPADQDKEVGEWESEALPTGWERANWRHSGQSGGQWGMPAQQTERRPDLEGIAADRPEELDLTMRDAKDFLLWEQGRLPEAPQRLKDAAATGQTGKETSMRAASHPLSHVGQEEAATGQASASGDHSIQQRRPLTHRVLTALAGQTQMLRYEGDSAGTVPSEALAGLKTIAREKAPITMVTSNREAQMSSRPVNNGHGEDARPNSEVARRPAPEQNLLPVDPSVLDGRMRGAPVSVGRLQGRSGPGEDHLEADATAFVRRAQGAKAPTPPFDPETRERVRKPPLNPSQLLRPGFEPLHAEGGQTPGGGPLHRTPRVTIGPAENVQVRQEHVMDLATGPKLLNSSTSEQVLEAVGKGAEKEIADHLDNRVQTSLHLPRAASDAQRATSFGGLAIQSEPDARDGAVAPRQMADAGFVRDVSSLSRAIAQRRQEFLPDQQDRALSSLSERVPVSFEPVERRPQIAPKAPGQAVQTPLTHAAEGGVLSPSGKLTPATSSEDNARQAAAKGVTTGEAASLGQSGPMGTSGALRARPFERFETLRPEAAQIRRGPPGSAVQGPWAGNEGDFVAQQKPATGAPATRSGEFSPLGAKAPPGSQKSHQRPPPATSEPVETATPLSDRQRSPEAPIVRQMSRQNSSAPGVARVHSRRQPVAAQVDAAAREQTSTAVEKVELEIAPAKGAEPREQVSVREPSQLARGPATAIKQLAEAIVSAGDRRVEVQLEPEELGRVNFKVTHSEQGMSLHISADRPETLDLLRRHADHLARLLSDTGCPANSFSFSGGRQGRSQTAGREHGVSVREPRAQATAAEASGATSIRSGSDILDLRL